MYVYTCEPTLEAMLSCIYVAWSSKLGHKNIRLQLEPLDQYTLFDEYIHVDADSTMASKVIDAMCYKISPGFYQQIAYTSMAYEPDVLDNMYHCMIMGFAFGPSALKMVQYEDIMRNQTIRTRLGREICSFQEVMRFHQVDNVYIAHYEPKSRITMALGPRFEDRMPSEHWMIIDDIHKEAAIHPKDEPFYIRQLNDLEYNRLLETEQINDSYTDLWTTFFHSVSIKERENPACQLNHFSKWKRKHAVEMN